MAIDEALGSHDEVQHVPCNGPDFDIFRLEKLQVGVPFAQLHVGVRVEQLQFDVRFEQMQVSVLFEQLQVGVRFEKRPRRCRHVYIALRHQESDKHRPNVTTSTQALGR